MRGEATRTQSTSGGEEVEPLGSECLLRTPEDVMLPPKPPPPAALTVYTRDVTCPAAYSAFRTSQTPQMSLNKGVGTFHTVTG